MNQFPYNRFNELQALLNGKRRNMPYKNMSGLFYGARGFVVRPSVASPGAIEITNYYGEKLALRTKGQTAPPNAIVTAFPDHFVLHKSRTLNTCSSRLIEWLTHGFYYLEKYRIRATNATHMLVPSIVSCRKKDHADNIRFYYAVPALGISNMEKYYDSGIQKKIRERGRELVSRNGFIYYSGVGPVSHEPVLNRVWVPNKRREYLHQVKELKKHGEIRAKMGAFDTTISNFYKTEYNIPYTWESLKLRKEQLVQQVARGGVEDHETYKRIMEAGLFERGIWRGSPPSELVPHLFDRGLEKMREGLRLATGAVVYS